MQYTYTKQKLSNGNTIHYKITEDGTHYQKTTSDEVVKVLQECRANDTRITVDYGDTKTGKSWSEKNDITGYVGRSTGTIKIPLLVYNKRSHGGGGLLDNCVIKIVTSSGKRVLYSLKTK